MGKRGDYQCPYCGVGIYDDESSYVEVCGVETECPECEKTFRVSSSVSVDYTTEGDCELLGTMPHKLTQDWGAKIAGITEYKCETCKREFMDWALPGGKYPKLKEGQFVMVGQLSPQDKQDG